MNHRILKLSSAGEVGPHREEGMAVVRELLMTLGSEPAPIEIGLVPSRAHEAIEAYVDTSFDVVTYDPCPRR